MGREHISHYERGKTSKHGQANYRYAPQGLGVGSECRFRSGNCFGLLLVVRLPHAGCPPPRLVLREARRPARRGSRPSINGSPNTKATESSSRQNIQWSFGSSVISREGCVGGECVRS